MSRFARPSRREILAAGRVILGTGRASAPPQQRVAAVGWAGAQTLLALGIAPVAMPEIGRYRSLVVAPPVPAEMRELGLRLEPNLELLKFLAPDLILSESGTEIGRPLLDRMGLRNAFSGATSFWGHTVVGLDVLAALDPTTRLVVLTSRVPSVQALLAMRPLWRALPFLREGRVTLLSDILFFGGLPSANRFGRLLAERLPLDDAARG